MLRQFRQDGGARHGVCLVIDDFRGNEFTPPPHENQPVNAAGQDLVCLAECEEKLAKDFKRYIFAPSSDFIVLAREQGGESWAVERLAKILERQGTGGELGDARGACS